jgi:hypothetical protein
MERVTDVTVVVNAAFTVHHDDRDGVVTLHHVEYQRHVRCLVGIVQGMQCLCPHLHAVALLLREVAHQEVGYQQRSHGNHRGCHHQQDFHLTNTVCPLHTLL